MRLREVFVFTRELASYGSTLLLSDNYSFRAGDVLISCRLTFTSTQEECKKPEEKTSSARTLLNVRPNKGAIPRLFERFFLISRENNRDCHITMPLSLKTREVPIKGDP